MKRAARRRRRRDLRRLQKERAVRNKVEALKWRLSGPFVVEWQSPDGTWVHICEAQLPHPRGRRGGK